jgi:Tfp pilus assembly protein FimT
MLVVLGVVVMVAALAQPALRSALGDSRLRSAARQLRAELAKARLRAMQSGTAQRFRYQPGAGHFEVAPADFDPEAEAEESQERGPAADTNLAARPPGEDVVEQDLPEGVSFEPVEETLTMAVDEEGWSEPIVFYPNGRTADARIRLRGERNAVVDLSLRGLTGVATASKPRHEEAEP